jgi:serine kinase of HPr protein (carbohydrate metabolism regulator)
MTAATIHASVVSLGGKGVLIRGGSGSGKSSLLLSLLMSGGDAVLVADDRVAVSADGGRLIAAVPEVIAGQIEVRGLGILRRPHVSPVVLCLVADLLPLAACPRLPTPEEQRVEIVGIGLPRVFLAVGTPDTAARVRAALAAFAPDFGNNTLI